MNGSEGGEPRSYEIYVAEHLPLNWQQAFSNLTIHHVKGGTCITGTLQDQSELHGVIRMIFNMGLTLQAVVEAKLDE
ncbi:hypothetical protein [Vibrio cyclitrophicus]|uniref:hypothetical protein n=1 Tax=Vibrio cyclitrophicus TaxID=47951 RepID=UPI000C82A08E|nr:hypothetical protein [Vibrio cyclitrophicus]PMH77120.1 hypothetical protein BCU59_10250 [Vibrio cyclitrophicus]